LLHLRLFPWRILTFRLSWPLCKMDRIITVFSEFMNTINCRRSCRAPIRPGSRRERLPGLPNGVPWIIRIWLAMRMGIFSLWYGGVIWKNCPMGYTERHTLLTRLSRVEG